MKNFTKSVLTLLTLLTLSFIINTAFAQSIHQNVLPEIGDILPAVGADATWLDEGPDGHGVVWDFSNITTVGDMTVTKFVHPNETPYASDFSGTNLASVLETPTGPVYGYYSQNNGDLHLLGNVAAGSKAIYTNPELMLPTPFNTSDYVWDEFEAVSQVGDNTMFTSGIKDFEIDASGTLMLPTETYENVVRMWSTIERVDSTMMPNGSVAKTILEMSQFDWYLPNLAWPLMTMVFVEGESVLIMPDGTEIVNPIPLTKALVYNPEAGVNTTSVYEVGESFIEEMNIAPNPAIDFVTVDFEAPEAVEGVLKVSNMVGQELLRKEVNINSGKNVQNVELNNLNTGIYLLTIQTKKSKISRKIIKH